MSKNGFSEVHKDNETRWEKAFHVKTTVEATGVKCIRVDYSADTISFIGFVINTIKSGGKVIDSGELGLEGVTGILIKNEVKKVISETIKTLQLQSAEEKTIPTTDYAQSTAKEESSKTSRLTAEEILSGLPEDQRIEFDNAANSSKIGKAEKTSFLNTGSGKILIFIVSYALIFGLTYMLWVSMGDVAIYVMLACAIFGWKKLSMIQPAMFVWMPLIGWIIYLVIKFIVSALIGLFVAPYYLAQLVSKQIYNLRT